jgi:hypothetical protein
MKWAVLLWVSVPGLWAAAALPTGETAGMAVVGADIIALQPAARAVVVRDADGHEERLPLGAGVSLSGVRPGDHVVLGIEGHTEGRRINVLSRVDRPHARPSAAPPREPASATEMYTYQVALLASQAGQVDVLWTGFCEECDVAVRGESGFSREWLSLWDERATYDASSAYCREVLIEIVRRGEPVNAAMLAVERKGREHHVPAGVRREVRRRFYMDGRWNVESPEPEDTLEVKRGEDRAALSPPEVRPASG